MVSDGERGCEVLRLLGAGWMVPILSALADGAARPSKLERLRFAAAPSKNTRRAQR
jgi:DNA-binding HxlR family transcriptional regulator